MKLKLVKQGNFLGTKCDFYVDEDENIYMSRTQIGYALQYKDPSNAIRNIHARHYKRLDNFSVEVTTAQIERVSKHQSKDKLTFMYTAKGIFEICRHSNQSVADDFYDYVYSVVIEIMENGYYIAAGKDEKWLGVRRQSKEARKQETDQIKLFIKYAADQGSSNAEKYYTTFTKLVNGKFGIESGQRDSLQQEMLMDMEAMERLIKMRIKVLMGQEVPYKQIYQEVKEMLGKL